MPIGWLNLYQTSTNHTPSFGKSLIVLCRTYWFCISIGGWEFRWPYTFLIAVGNLWDRLYNWSVITTMALLIKQGTSEDEAFGGPYTLDACSANFAYVYRLLKGLFLFWISLECGSPDSCRVCWGGCWHRWPGLQKPPRPTSNAISLTSNLE